MLAAPARYVSVSELYSTDEVELLLDEIRDLEPTSCRGEDVQDFEIAGSGCGGGRSPAGTERSWDSHAQYRRAPPPPPRPLAPLYCRWRHLLTVQGACALLVVACSACVCALVWGGAGMHLGGGGGTGAALRALQLAALTSLLLHAALVAMRLSALHLLMPLPWDALGAACCAWSACWLAGGALALLRAMLVYHADAPQHIRDMFFSAIGVACAGSACAGVGAGVWARARLRAARARAAAATRGAYRAVPPAPPPEPEPEPSTSRHAPL